MSAMTSPTNCRVRLFRSDILEWTTLSTPWSTLLIWVGILLLLDVTGWPARFAVLPTLGCVALAISAWAVTEYVTHRFVYHGRYLGRVGASMRFMMHGCHHVDPSDPGRNMTPLVVSVPVGLAILWLSYTLLGAGYARVFFTVYVLAYLAFDLTHYACHQYRGTSTFLQYLGKQHLLHHQHADTNFGVLFVLVDRICKTRFADRRAVQSVPG
jgi:sterol desaturase/sphingolipid hydroxylase (fatty acid hydroxylase superfamily)